ncbi:programmed cell death protein 2 [Entophlyctis helioformis]|nr:programmed cell death protein 2 [Entophlyctis helioformis]
MAVVEELRTQDDHMDDELDDDTNAAATGLPVQLGFIVNGDGDNDGDDAGPIEPLPLLASDIDNFPNKVGGLPVWLDPSNPLTAKDVECSMCSQPMALLCQLYTPENAAPQAFHRVVMLFCCKNGPCHRQPDASTKCFKLFRTQMPQENAVYTPDGVLKDSDFDASDLCRVCGLKGSLRCTQCKAVRYCSKAHAVLDWSTGNHKATCGASGSASSDADAAKVRSAATFPEFEVVSEDEPPLKPVGSGDSDAIRDAGADVDKLAETLQGIPIEEPAADEALEDSHVDVDSAFLKFQQRVALSPEQVLRYARVDEIGAPAPAPLVVSDVPFAPNGVPVCSHCNGEVSFEFQIMPQLLNHLGVDNFDRNALDWGTVLAFTCASNCQPEGLRYIQETVYTQDFSEAGLGDSIRQALEQRAAAKAAGEPIEEDDEQ